MSELDDPHAELAAIAAGVRQHLLEEHDLGGAGLPAVAVPAPPRAQAAPARPQASLAAVTPAGPAAIAPAAASDKVARLQLLAEQAASCDACALHEKRKQAVFARGDPSSPLVFVGEGPGRDEDRLGEPFVGKAGQLLDRMIAAMGFERDAVYICNVVKCRPPDNRTPRPEEALACARFLVPQVQIVAPRVIVALGRCAAENLGVAEAAGPWRGRWGSFQGIDVMPTFHPAYLLRSPQYKRTVWEDLQKVMARFGFGPTPGGAA
ncbi:MAG: uracil-DNA glycosylase [Myxococcales bacterium]|nr:uracil-DNA glycosylase [Myxococcales bacterium]